MVRLKKKPDPGAKIWEQSSMIGKGGPRKKKEGETPFGVGDGKGGEKGVQKKEGVGGALAVAGKERVSRKRKGTILTQKLLDAEECP